MQDKRIFQRVLFSHDAKLIHLSTTSTIQVLDLSLNGFLCTPPTNKILALNDDVTLELTLGQNKKIIMQSTIVDIDHSHLSMQCHHIDIDSISELKRLIQLNLANNELLNRDLSLLAR